MWTSTFCSLRQCHSVGLPGLFSNKLEDATMWAQVTYFFPRVSCIQNKASRDSLLLPALAACRYQKLFQRDPQSSLQSSAGERIETVPQMENTLSSLSSGSWVQTTPLCLSEIHSYSLTWGKQSLPFLFAKPSDCSCMPALLGNTGSLHSRKGTSSRYVHSIGMCLPFQRLVKVSSWPSIIILWPSNNHC